MKYIWKIKNPDIFIVFLAFLLIYGIFYRIIVPIFLKKRNLQGFSSNHIVYRTRFLSSFLFFFIVFYITKTVLKKSLIDLGIRLSFPLVGIILYIIIFPILFKYASYQSSKIAKAEENISLEINWKEVLRILISWLFYIAGYEMLYRGVLLFTLVPYIGKWEAITVVTSIYFFDHISRDYYLAAGSFIIGFVFGYIVLLRNSVFESIILHYFIATTTDIVILLRIKRYQKKF